VTKNNNPLAVSRTQQQNVKSNQCWFNTIYPNVKQQLLEQA